MTHEALTELRERWTGSRERLARMLDAMDIGMRRKHGHGLPPEVMALGNVFHPEPVVLDLLDERDRLAARVLEMEAPGECQSLHKLRADLVAAQAAMTRALAERDNAQEQSAERLAELCLANSSCDDYAREVAALRAERDELAAEVAAYQGRPEGALPGWARGPYTERGFERREGGTTMRTGASSGCRWMVARKGTADYDSGDATSPRSAMRVAEAAARSRGWM